eukprot:3154376-Amphidinium_carterae.1
MITDHPGYAEHAFQGATGNVGRHLDQCRVAVCLLLVATLAQRLKMISVLVSQSPSDYAHAGRAGDPALEIGQPRCLSLDDQIGHFENCLLSLKTGESTLQSCAQEGGELPHVSRKRRGAKH